MGGILLLAQTGTDGFRTPQGTAGWFWFLVFAAVIGALWVIVQRTRRRHEEEYWERKRREHQDD